jgi:hypothetical protein
VIYCVIAINPGYEDIKHINKVRSAIEDIGQLKFNICSGFQCSCGIEQKLQPWRLLHLSKV